MREIFSQAIKTGPQEQPSWRPCIVWAELDRLGRTGSLYQALFEEEIATKRSARLFALAVAGGGFAPCGNTFFDFLGDFQSDGKFAANIGQIFVAVIGIEHGRLYEVERSAELLNAAFDFFGKLALRRGELFAAAGSGKAARRFVHIDGAGERGQRGTIKLFGRIANIAINLAFCAAIGCGQFLEPFIETPHVQELAGCFGETAACDALRKPIELVALIFVPCLQIFFLNLAGDIVDREEQPGKGDSTSQHHAGNSGDSEPTGSLSEGPGAGEQQRAQHEWHGGHGRGDESEEHSFMKRFRFHLSPGK